MFKYQKCRSQCFHVGCSFNLKVISAAFGNSSPADPRCDQVLESSFLSTDLSSNSAYCSKRARVFSPSAPSPLTSGSTRCEEGWGRESSSALTVSRVSDRMLLISFWSWLGCCSTWFNGKHASEKQEGGSAASRCLLLDDCIQFLSHLCRKEKLCCFSKRFGAHFLFPCLYFMVYFPYFLHFPILLSFPHTFTQKSP